MAEFKDGGLWAKIAFLLVMLAFAQELFGFAMGMGTTYNTSSVEACLIIGFLCFLAAIILVLCLTFLNEVAGNKIAKIVFIILIFIAGLVTVIGIAIWGGKYDDANADPPTFPTMVGCCGALCAILSGIFAVLDLLGVKSG